MVCNCCDVLGKLLSHKEEKLEKEGTRRPFIPDGHERLTQMGWGDNASAQLPDSRLSLAALEDQKQTSPAARGFLPQRGLEHTIAASWGAG